MASDKDPVRVAAGLKATIHNPNTSEEAKERATDRLEQMSSTEEGQGASQSAPAYTTSGDEEISNLQEGGYTATSRSEKTTQDHVREILQSAGYNEGPPDLTDEEHQIRVLAGYKAALHNPKVSEEAKAHARQILTECGEL